MTERKKKAALNSIASILSQGVILALAFVIRRKLVWLLGMEIVGLNGVLNEIISMLSLSEAGIAASIIYRLYAPVAKDDEKTICKYFTLFRKAYHIIGTCILAAGLALTPALGVMVRVDTLEAGYVRTAYLLCVAGSALSFGISYYRTLYVVYQRQYFCNGWDTALYVVFGGLKLLAITACRSYLLFILLQAVQGISGNLLIRYCCRRDYPFIRRREELEKPEFRAVFKDVKDIAVSRAAGYVYSSTDNLIISAMCGTVAAGLISNYKCVFTPIRTVINLVNSALVPAWGNYMNQEERMDAAYELFQRYTFLQYLFVSVILAPAMALMDQFIALWLGTEYIVARPAVLLMGADIFINALQEPNMTILSVAGMFRENRIISEAATAVNLILSVLGAFYLGSEGVLLGTVIALCCFWAGRSRMAVRKYFQAGRKEYAAYWVRNGIYILAFWAEYAALAVILPRIRIRNTALEFLACGLFSVIFGVLFQAAIWHKSRHFLYCKELLAGFCRRRKG